MSDLESENQAQQVAIDALEAENQALTDRLACVKSASNASEFVFEGCNVYVRNGAGQTNSINGFGNLIVGYDEERIDYSCSLGFFYNSNQTDCEAAGGIWWTSNKTGSHNMVIGTEHNYNSFGGFVAGTRNTISDEYASVSGGAANTAADRAASVSGGGANSATGWYASVSGGSANIAKGEGTSVSGGEGCIHQAGSQYSWGVGDTVFGTGCVSTNNTP